MNVTNVPLCQTMHQAADAAGYCARDTEPLEKVIKLSNRGITMTGIFFGLSTSASLVSSQFKNAFEMFESIRIFALGKLLTVPDENGKYYLANKTWQKKTDRAFLTAHLTLKFFNGCHRLALINLGQIAKVSIGFLPIWKLVYDGLMVCSSVFNTWDCALSINDASKKLNIANHKIEKWEARKTTIALVKAGNQTEITSLDKKYSKKVDELNKDNRLYNDILQKLDSNHPDYAKLSPQERQTMRKDYKAKAAETAKKIATKLPIWQRRLDKIAARNYQGLGDDLASKDCVGKVKKWEKIQDVQKYARTRGWLGVANAVAKIIVIVLALTFSVFLTNFTAPYLFPIVFFGIINDGSGLARLVLDRNRNKPKALPV